MEIFWDELIRRRPNALNAYPEEDAYPDFCVSDGTTVLHIAAWLGNIDAVKFLLQNGANPNKEDSRGLTPIHVAAIWNQDAILEILLPKGDPKKEIRELCTYVDPRLVHTSYSKLATKMASKFSVLHCAFACVSTKCILLLLPRADINAVDSDDRSPLFHLGSITIREESEDRFIDLIKATEKAGGKLKEDGYSALKCCITKEWPRALQYLSDKGAASALLHGDTQMENILHHAAKIGSTSMLQLLLKNKTYAKLVNIPTGFSSQTPLYIAVVKGYTGCADLLLQAGAEFRILGLLQKIIMADFPDLLQKMTDLDKVWCWKELSRQLPDSQDMNCLHIAAQNKSSKCLEYILHCYVMVHGQPKSHPLFAHCYSSTFMSSCEAMEERDYIGRTPLHVAAQARSQKCVKTLIEKGASIAATTIYRRTALQMIFKNDPNAWAMMEDILDNCITIVDIPYLTLTTLLRQKRNRFFYDDDKAWVILDYGILLPSTEQETQINTVYSVIAGAQDFQEKYFASHPLIESFIMLKWNKVFPLFLFYFLSYILFVINLTIYSFIKKTYGQYHPYFMTSRIFLGILCSICFIFVGPGMFLLLTKSSYSFKYVGSGTIIRSLPICVGFITVFGNADNRWINAINAYNIIFAWMGIIFHTERLTVFGRYSCMFREVIYLTLQFSLFFLLVIMGFAFVFYNFFHVGEGKGIIIYILEVISFWSQSWDYGFTEVVKVYSGAKIYFFLAFLAVCNIALMIFVDAVTVSHTRRLHQMGLYMRIREQMIFLWLLEQATFALNTRLHNFIQEYFSVSKYELFKVSELDDVFDNILMFAVLDVATTK